MRSTRITGFTVVALLLGASACNPTPNLVVSRDLAAVAPGEVRRLAVMPFAIGAGVGREPAESGQEPIVETPAETVQLALRDGLALYQDWTIVGEQVTADVVQQVTGSLAPPTPEQARAIGVALQVDAVLRGEVRTYVERIGTGLGVKRPAHVGFSVEMLRMPDATVVWQAQFNKEQQALSDNLLNLPGFFRTGARWVKARDLAVIGGEQVAYQLHVLLFGEKATPRPRAARRE